MKKTVPSDAKIDCAILAAVAKGPRTYQEIAEAGQVDDTLRLAINLGRMVLAGRLNIWNPPVFTQRWPVYYVGKLPQGFKGPLRPGVDHKVAQKAREEAEG